MSAKYKSPSFLLPNELNTSANPANDTGINSLYSMDFDSTTKIPNITGLGLGTSVDTFSISLWFNKSDMNYGIVFSTYSGSGTYPSTGVAIDLNTNGTIAFYNGANRTTTSAQYSINTWYNLVVTSDGTTVKMYVNGSQVTLDSTIVVARNFTNVWINSAKYSSNNFGITGKIDEVAIFNRALNTTEIAALYEGTSPNIYPSNLMATDLNPIAYYPLGEQAQNSGYPSATGNEWQFPNGVLQDYVMDFDGSTDYIDAGSSAGVIGTGVRTFSMWLKTSNTGGQTILSTRNQSTDDGWVVQITSTTVQFYNEKSNKMIYTTLSPTLSNGSWHNVVIIRGGSTATNAIYVDGNPINLTINTENGTSPESSSNLSIGSTITSASYPGFFDGQMSNLAIWNTDQSTNIANIYNNGSPQTTYTVTPQNWWKLNATSVYTPSAPNYTTALDFVASQSDYIDAGSSIGLIGTGVRTFSVWLKTSNTAIQTILGTRDVNIDGWVIQWNGPNTGVLFYRPGGVNNGIYSTTGNAANLTDGNWHHLVIVRAGTGNNKIYVDGVSQTLNTAFGDENLTDPQSSKNLLIGAGYTTGGALFRYFDGKISNLAIYNSALSASQVSTLFNFGTPETAISFDPQAWWKLDDQTAITDSSGNGNTGTNNGATDISSGVAVIPSWKIPTALTIPTINYTTALNFDGNDYIDIAYNTSLNLGTKATWNMWVKWDDITKIHCFASRWDSGQKAWYIQKPSAQNIEFNIEPLTGSYSYNSWPISGFSGVVDTWYNLCFVYDSSLASNADKLKFYANGVLQTPSTTFGSFPSTLPVTTSKIRLAEFSAGFTGRYFEGSMSNFSLWNAALTSAQVSTLYNSGQPETAISFSPVSWWKLNSTTITDSVGSNNGTNNGATQVTSDVYVGNIPVNGVSTTLPSTALQQSDLQFDSPYSNYSLSFDGTTYIDTTLDIATNSDFSVSFWFNWNQNQKVIITDSNFDAWSSIGFGFQIMSSGEVKLLVGDNGSSTGKTLSTSANSITANTWYHIVGVCDLNNEIRLYLNGTSVDNTSVGSSRNETSNNIRIGGDYSSTKRLLSGKLDETSIFNYSLTSSQVLEIYNNGRPKDLTNFSGTAPISWWRLGENAYFQDTTLVLPNSITGAPNGEAATNNVEMISADAPGTYANGIGTNLDILDRVGDAPLSTSNSQSYNMIPSDISPYVPQYVGKQIANNFSMNFDGSQRISLTNAVDIYAASIWFKPSSDITSSSVRQYLLGFESPSYVTGKGVQIGSSGSALIICHAENSQTIYTTSTVTLSGWNHIVVNYNSTTQRYDIYLNAVKVNNGTGGTAAGVISSTGLVFGNRAALPVPFTGKLDEVAIFDTALNAGQIYNDIYQPTATGTNQTADLVNNPNLPNPVAWYRMGD